MKAVGIIAEYNPFHTGHAYHIAATRQQVGESKGIICVMSGNWVQRGECAVTDKWTRSSMALRGGADLVLELPLPWAISSAERFAQGGVAALKATGVVDTISFGSESGKTEELCIFAQVFETSSFENTLKEKLSKGISFAAARQEAVLKLVGSMGKLLLGPNDNLGVEYIRAAGKELAAIAIPRQGTAHDSACPTEGFASASHLRRLAREQKWEAMSSWVEQEDLRSLKDAGVSDMSYVERAMLARLRQMDEQDFAALPDSGSAEGLPTRLMRAAKTAGSLEEFYTQAKTKRYAHSRIRRLALWAFLNMTETDRPQKPSYLRVLGFNARGRELLKELKTAAALPVLTKPAHIKELPAEARQLFALECRATDLFGLCFEASKPAGLELITTPIFQ